MRLVKDYDPGKTCDRTLSLIPRAHWFGHVFVANTQIEGQVRANSPVIIEIRRVAQEAERNSAGAGAAFSGNTTLGVAGEKSVRYCCRFA